MSLLSCSTFSVRGHLPSQPRRPGLPLSLQDDPGTPQPKTCRCSLPERWLGRRGLVWTQCLQLSRGHQCQNTIPSVAWRHNYLQAMTRNNIVEVDLRSDDIMAEWRRSPLHRPNVISSDAPSTVESSVSVGPPSPAHQMQQFLVPSLRELWDSERRRRKALARGVQPSKGSRPTDADTTPIDTFLSELSFTSPICIP